MNKPIAEMMNLSGKAAIVTGGAMGIGEAIVRRLHEAGASVTIADLNTEVADKLAAELNTARADSAFVVTANVAEDADVAKMISGTVEKFGAVDILVNNAGIYPFSPLATLTADDFMKVINVNLKGVFLTTKAASEQMKKQGGGKIINIASIDSLHPSMVGLAAYDASKHGVYGFTKNVAMELAESNIWVNAIAPGGILTPGAGAGSTAPVDPAVTEAFLKQIPMHRMGMPDEIGKVALFLASDLSSYMCGELVVVDGGRLLG